MISLAHKLLWPGSYGTISRFSNWHYSAPTHTANAGRAAMEKRLSYMNLGLAMLSLMLPLPSLLLHLFPSLRVDHTALLPWLLVEPHCATQAASGFPDSIKKCRREKEMQRKRLQAKAWASLVGFFRAWYARHIVGFFCRWLPPFRLNQCYLVQWAT